MKSVFYENINFFSFFSFAGPVVYDTSQFLCTNRDVIPDDLITVFGKENCQFGFASHLFATELRNLQNNYPRGACFRISPAAGSASANTAISQGNLLKDIDNWSVAAESLVPAPKRSHA